MLKYMLKYIDIFYAKSELIEKLYKLAAKHYYSDYFIRIQYHIYKVHCSISIVQVYNGCHWIALILNYKILITSLVVLMNLTSHWLLTWKQREA